MTTSTKLDDIWKILGTVNDPEVPVLTILDLGIVREVKTEGDRIVVVITPTYSGCPAMNVIEFNIRAALMENGIDQFEIKTILSPPWTTDWLSEAGREKLRAYGIAPPQGKARIDTLLGERIEVPCPLCESTNTELLSEFGSTACKALYRCKDCLEPFDYFKCH